MAQVVIEGCLQAWIGKRMRLRLNMLEEAVHFGTWPLTARLRANLWRKIWPVG